MVAALDIPSILAASGEERCSLLKVDIERSEVEVFSAKGLGWLDQIDNIAIELHDKECEEVFFRAIEGRGFEVGRSGELTICRKKK